MKSYVKTSCTENLDNIFEKKTNNYEKLKNLMNEYTKLSNQFSRWGYDILEKEIVPEKSTFIYLIPFLLYFFPVLETVDHMNINNITLKLLVIMGLFSTMIPVMYLIRSPQFGLFKNKYKKWLLLQNDINNILGDSDNICYIVIDRQLYLKDLEKTLNCSEEIKKLVVISNNKKIDDLKNELLSFEENSEKIIEIQRKLESLESTNEINQIIEKAENKIKKQEKIDKLNKKLTQYNSTNNITKDIKENSVLEKFKALL